MFKYRTQSPENDLPQIIYLVQEKGTLISARSQCHQNDVKEKTLDDPHHCRIRRNMAELVSEGSEDQAGNWWLSISQ